MNKGASRPPALTGSITIDNSGMPTMENPPPNAPFMKQIRNTPAKATRIVATVSSMRPPPQLTRAGVLLRVEPPRPRRPSSHPRLVGRSDETVDRRFDLGTIEPDVAQCAVVKLAKAGDGGAPDEIARDSIATSAEKARDWARPLRDLRPNDRR